MKRILFSTILLFFLTHYSVSAVQHPGLKAGVNFISMKSDQIDFNSSIGFGGGFASLWVMNDKLDFQIDFTFEQVAIKVMANEGGGFSGGGYKEYDLSNNGVYGTIIGNYHVIPYYLSVNAGFIYGVSWSKDEYYGEQIYAGKSDYNEDNFLLSSLSSAMSGFDYYASVGVSGGLENLRLNLRYQFGLKNYFKTDELYYPEYSMKRNIFQISITYIFNNSQIVRN